MGAVPPEIEGLQHVLTDIRPFSVGGRSGLVGTVSGAAVGGIVTGPGPLNAAQASTALAETLRPRALIQIGCAGAFSSFGVGMGDVVVGTEVIDASSGLESPDPDRFVDPLPFPVLRHGETKIQQTYPVDHLRAERVADYLVRWFSEDPKTRVTTGPILSVSTITATDKRADLLFKDWSPAMEAMEGAGMAHVCHHYKIPFIEVRVASNCVGGRDRGAWDLDGAFEKCRRILSGLLAADLPQLLALSQ